MTSAVCEQCRGFSDVAAGRECGVGVCSTCGRAFALPAVPVGVRVDAALTGGGGRTAAYGDGAAGRTAGYGSAAGTRPRGAPGGTAPYGGTSAAYGVDADTAAEPLAQLQPGTTIGLESGAYEVVRVLSSAGATREACIYEIRSGRESYALKVYLDPERGPNFETLSRIAKLDAEHVLPLYEYGRVRRGVPFERSALAQGGDMLAVAPDRWRHKYSDQFVEKVVLPQLVHAVTALNSVGVHHTDLKPENVLYLDRAQTYLAVCDYGSAKARYEDQQRSFRASSHVLATAPYAPMEVVFSWGHKAQSPFYSIGKILLRLLYPDEFINAQPRIREREHYGKQLVDYRREHTRFADLIQGLTLERSEHRWGADEVERWMRGERVRVRNPSEGTGPAIKLGVTTVREPAELLRYIESDPSWYSTVIEDSQGYGQLLAWVADVTDLPRKSQLDDSIRAVRADGPAFVKEVLRRFLDPERPLTLGRQQFSLRAANADVAARDYFVSLDKASRVLEDDEFRLRIFQLQLALRAFPDSVVGQMLAHVDPIAAHRRLAREAFILMVAHLSGDRGFVGEGRERCASLEEVGLYFARHPNRYTDPVHVAERRAFAFTHDRRDLADADYVPFLLATLARRQRAEVRFVSVHRGVAHESMTVTYDIARSLTDYLREHGIANDRAVASTERHESTFRVDATRMASAMAVADRASAIAVAEIVGAHCRDGRKLSTASVDRFQQELSVAIADIVGAERVVDRARRNDLVVAVLRDAAIALAYILPVVVTAVVFGTRYGYLHNEYAAALGTGSYFAPETIGEVLGAMWWAGGTLAVSFIPAAILGGTLPGGSSDDRQGIAVLVVSYAVFAPAVVLILAIVLVIVLWIPGWLMGFDYEAVAEQISEGLFAVVGCLLVAAGAVMYWHATFHAGRRPDRPYAFGVAVAALVTLCAIAWQVTW